MAQSTDTFVHPFKFNCSFSAPTNPDGIVRAERRRRRLQANDQMKEWRVEMLRIPMRECMDITSDVNVLRIGFDPEVPNMYCRLSLPMLENRKAGRGEVARMHMDRPFKLENGRNTLVCLRVGADGKVLRGNEAHNDRLMHDPLKSRMNAARAILIWRMETWVHLIGAAVRPPQRSPRTLHILYTLPSHSPSQVPSQPTAAEAVEYLRDRDAMHIFQSKYAEDWLARDISWGLPSNHRQFDRAIEQLARSGSTDVAEYQTLFDRMPETQRCWAFFLEDDGITKLLSIFASSLGASASQSTSQSTMPPAPSELPAVVEPPATELPATDPPAVVQPLAAEAPAASSAFRPSGRGILAFFHRTPNTGDSVAGGRLATRATTSTPTIVEAASGTGRPSTALGKRPFTHPVEDVVRRPLSLPLALSTCIAVALHPWRTASSFSLSHFPVFESGPADDLDAGWRPLRRYLRRGHHGHEILDFTIAQCDVSDSRPPSPPLFLVLLSPLPFPPSPSLSPHLSLSFSTPPPSHSPPFLPPSHPLPHPKCVCARQLRVKEQTSLITQFDG